MVQKTKQYEQDVELDALRAVEVAARGAHQPICTECRQTPTEHHDEGQSGEVPEGFSGCGRCFKLDHPAIPPHAFIPDRWNSCLCGAWNCTTLAALMSLSVTRSGAFRPLP